MLEKPVSTKTSKKIRQTVIDKTGFEPDELLAAPVKPPELKNTRPSPRPEQLWIIVLGFVLAVVGLAIVGATGSVAGTVITALGALAIAIATLVRI